MAKKYRYNIFYPYTFGTIDLTKKEAAIVAYAMDKDNWSIILDEPYSRSCWIDIDHPHEVEDQEMSCVLSKIFNHKDSRGAECKLKSYALDDRFYLDMERYSMRGGVQCVYMDFSVDEALTIKKQLEEFIEQNSKIRA